MADVRMFQTDDGGEISIASGRVGMDDGPETAAYLSLFGGDVDDDGTDATRSKQWWGNLIEVDPARHLRSETQHLLQSLPATPSNVPVIAGAVERDLAWMESALGAEISVTVSMAGLNKARIVVSIVVNGEQFGINAVRRWGSA